MSGFVSVALSLGLLPVAVSNRPTLGCPDFPPLLSQRRPSGDLILSYHNRINLTFQSQGAINRNIYLSVSQLVVLTVDVIVVDFIILRQFLNLEEDRPQVDMLNPVDPVELLADKFRVHIAVDYLGLILGGGRQCQLDRRPLRHIVTGNPDILTKGFDDIIVHVEKDHAATTGAGIAPRSTVGKEFNLGVSHKLNCKASRLGVPATIRFNHRQVWVYDQIMASPQASQIRALERHVSSLARTEKIRPVVWHIFMELLAELKDHNPEMYAHSLRVGIYAHGLAANEGENDLKFPLYAGCGHDIGKCEVQNAYLDSKNMTPAEFEHIKEHATRGYERLKDKFLYTSFVAGLHHSFQDHGYGIDLKEVAPKSMPADQIKRIEAMARLVAIADFFDALTTRNNNKGYIDDPSDPDQQRTVMTAHFPDQETRISWLILHRI